MALVVTPPPAVVSFLPVLVQGVKDYFTAYACTANVAYGWKALTRQDNQGPGGANRVVIAPDPKSAGKFTGARKNVGHSNPMPILTWEKDFLVSVWAYDPTAPDDELKHFCALEKLVETTVAAIRSVAHADGKVEGVGDPGWTPTPVERVFGLELRFPILLRGPLFGPANPTVKPTAAVPDKEFEPEEP